MNVRLGIQELFQIGLMVCPSSFIKENLASISLVILQQSANGQQHFLTSPSLAGSSFPLGSNVVFDLSFKIESGPLQH